MNMNIKSQKIMNTNSLKSSILFLKLVRKGFLLVTRMIWKTFIRVREISWRVTY